jgi:hypothetical protein
MRFLKHTESLSHTCTHPDIDFELPFRDFWISSKKSFADDIDFILFKFILSTFSCG